MISGNKRVTSALTVAAIISISSQFPASAQVNIRAEALEYYNACLNDAANNDGVIQSGGRISYTCTGTGARRYFDYLVSRDAAESEEQRRTGRYVFKKIPNVGQCWHRIENADGTSTSSYGCTLSVAGPPN